MKMPARLALASLLAAGLLGLAVAAPAPVVHGAAKTLEPLMPGWEGIFKLDWEVAQKRGQEVLSGYVMNDSPYLLGGVRLLVDGLDDRGEIASQRVTYVFGDMTPFSRSYFETPAPGRHPKYQVRVFAYDRIEGANGPFP